MEAFKRRPWRKSGRRRYFICWTRQITQFHLGVATLTHYFPEKTASPSPPLGSVLLQSGQMLLFRLDEKSKSRKVRFPRFGSRGRRQDPLISRERTRRRRHPKMGDTAQDR